MAALMNSSTPKVKVLLAGTDAASRHLTKDMNEGGCMCSTVARRDGTKVA